MPVKPVMVCQGFAARFRTHVISDLQQGEKRASRAILEKEGLFVSRREIVDSSGQKAAEQIVRRTRTSVILATLLVGLGRFESWRKIVTPWRS